MNSSKMEFYITLPSNVKHDTFENKVTHYKTKLASTVQLENDWSVGLSTISYTKSWKEKREPGTVSVYYFLWRSKTIQKEITINLMKYTLVEDIIDFINEELEKIGKEFKESDVVTKDGVTKTREITFEFPKLYLNPNGNRVELQFSLLRNAIVSLKMSDNLTRIFGFDKNKLDNFIESKHKIYRHKMKTWYIGKKVDFSWLDTTLQDPPIKEELIYIAEEPYNLKDDFDNIYLYCNLVKHNFVGDSITQLLRLIEIPPDSKYRDQITVNYTNVFFHKLSMNEFDSIEVELKNDLNEHIPFLFGRVIITLHFKKFIKNSE